MAPAHDGNVDALLGEHQFAFVRWLVKQDDEAALKHWSDLTQAFYNAGEFGIESAPNLFGPLVETLMLQLALLHDSMLTPTSAAIYGASYLAEDLQDVDDQPLLNSKGAAFEAFLDVIG